MNHEKLMRMFDNVSHGKAYALDGIPDELFDIRGCP
jgi:hypothetical protein